MTPAEIERVFDWYSADLPQNATFQREISRIFFWPLCCLFFLDIRILINPLVSSNSSYVSVNVQ
jgi:hypothetical protein